MNEIIIRKPIWSTMSIGIADYKIVSDIIVEIEYKRKGEKERMFPDKYFMKKEKALSYPVMSLGTVKLKIIPIADFEIVKK